MIGATRSEFVRLLRPRMLLGWFGLITAFTLLINGVMFSTSGDDLPPGGPGVVFPDAATLAGPEGLVIGLSAAASMFGIVTLSFWALVTATDYSSGLIRLLVAAQPRRWKLLSGKVIALAGVTVVATSLALVVNLGIAPMAAQAGGIDPEGWRETVSLSLVAQAWGNALLASLVWGVIGLVLAVVLRSSALAISIGVGWVLVVEGVVSAAFDSGVDWLPGTVMTALAQGGNQALSYENALLLGALYVVIALSVAFVVGWRRDVTD